MAFPFRRRRTPAEPESTTVRIVGFVNANSGLRATGGDSSLSAGIAIGIHAAVLALTPFWRLGVGFEEYKRIVGFGRWAAIEDRYGGAKHNSP